MTHTSKPNGLSLTRGVYVVSVVAAALTSLALLLNEGRNTPVFLLILYIGWVVSPFLGLLLALSISKRWTTATRTAIYCLMPVVIAFSLAAYTGQLTSPETRPAAIFLMVPLFSWMLMVIAISTTVLLSRRRV